MHLVEIDIIGLQPLETALHFAHDVHAGRAAPIEIFAHREPDFGRQDDFLSKAPQGFTHLSFTLAEAVYVRGINEVDAAVQG